MTEGERPMANRRQARSDVSDGTVVNRNRARVRARAPSHEPTIPSDVSGATRGLPKVALESASDLHRHSRGQPRVLPVGGGHAGRAAPEKALVKQPENKVDRVDRLTESPAGDRIAELGEILALGQLRLLARNSRGKPSQNGESSLDFSVTESGHPTPIGVSDA
jgi:hypothetical protein